VSGHPLDRAAAALGSAGVLAVVFWPLSGDPWEFTKIGPVAAAVTVILGGVAVAAGRLGRPELGLVAGAGYLLAALLQVAQAGRDANWVGGDGSTSSYFLGLGVGLLAIATVRRTEIDVRE
jgi:hypothetical protein